MVKFNALQSAIIEELKVHDEPLNEPLTDKILRNMRTNFKVSYIELSEKFDVSVSTIKRAIKILYDVSVIERKDGKRYGYWEVKIWF